MSLEQAIELFARIESGKNPSIGLHLHEAIRAALKTRWEVKNVNVTFSEFLHALQKEEYHP